MITDLASGNFVRRARREGKARMKSPRAPWWITRIDRTWGLFLLPPNGTSQPSYSGYDFEPSPDMFILWCNLEHFTVFPSCRPPILLILVENGQVDPGKQIVGIDTKG